MELKIPILLFQWLFCLAIAQQVQYIAISPQYLSRLRTYNIPIKVFSSDSSISSTAVSVSLLDSSNVERTTFSGVIPIDATIGSGSIPLSLSSDIPDGDYTMKVSSSYFTGNTTVTVSGDDYLVLVETDKPLYQPGQSVSILVLVVSHDLKPVAQNVQIEISDPAQNRIARVDSATDEYGMTSMEFPLATQTILGDWTVSVSTLTGVDKTPIFSQSVTFNVSTYKLPLFDVKITPGKTTVSKDDVTVDGTIAAKYTYGEGVSGSVEIRLLQKVMNFWALEGDVMAPGGARSMPFPGSGDGGVTLLSNSTVQLRDGSASFSLALGSNFQQIYSTLIIEAKVTEQSTGNTESGSSTLQYSYSSKELKLIGEAPAVRPGLPFQMILTCTSTSNTGTTRCADGQYRIDYSYYNGTDWIEGNALITTSNGVASYVLDVPKNISSCSVYVVGTADTTLSASLSPCKIMWSPSNSYILISASSEEGTPNTYLVGDPIVISYQMTINSTVLPSPITVNYEVSARGEVLSTKSLQTTTFNGQFAITVDPLMSPSATVLVWVKLGNGEIIADNLPLLIQESLPLQFNTRFLSGDIKETAPVTTVTPGADVRVEVNGTTKMRVSFTTVDQAVYLLADSKRFNAQQVLQALQNNQMNVPNNMGWDWSNYYSAADAFKNAGLLVITNVDVPSHPSNGWGPINFDGPVMDMAPNADAGGAVPMAAPAGGQARNAASPQAAPDAVALAKVRSYFPERWMFTNVTTDLNGYAVLDWTAPDSITTWNLHAVGVSPQLGLGISETSLKVFKSFFVTPNLPVTAIMGEEIVLTLAAYNYNENDVDVILQVDNSNFYTFGSDDSITTPTSNAKPGETATYMTQSIRVAAGGIGSGQFIIKPVKLGFIPIKVWGCMDEKICDVVEQVLQVLPPGIRQEFVINNLVDLTNGTAELSFPLTLPTDDVVAGSEYVAFSATGDVMGHSMSNLDSLVQMPTGCGEQTMINFAPCVFVNDYIQATGQNQPALTKKTLLMMNIGYQRELTYRHDDGSYSAFGNSDPSGSMWLTAFVVKSFAQASPFIFIDPKALDISTEYMAQLQNKEGSFPQTGQVIHTDLYGGLSGIAANTAYCLIALLESGRQTDAVTRAITYLVQEVHNWGPTTPVYNVAIITYALSKASSQVDPSVLQTAYQRLMSLAITDEKGTHWQNAEDTTKTAEGVASRIWCPMCNTGNSAEVEITSYGLLAILQKGPSAIGDAVGVAKWLSGQRNSLGGYYSTQDTVMGLQALAEYAKATRSPNTNMNLKLSNTAGFEGELTISESNFDLLQSLEVSDAVGTTVTLQATGTGKAATQMLIRFNVLEVKRAPAFDLKVDYTRQNLLGNAQKVRMCAAYTPSDDSTEASMVVAEVGMFTGFTPDTTSLDKLVKDGSIKRYDVTATSVALYFETITLNTTCVEFFAFQTNKVFKQQPAVSSIYSYYAPEQRASVVVNPPLAQSLQESNSNSSLALPLGLALGLGLPVLALLVYFLFWQSRRLSSVGHMPLPEEQPKHHAASPTDYESTTVNESTSQN